MEATSALLPSMTKRRDRSLRTPRATRSSMSALHVLSFSVAPSCRPSTDLNGGDERLAAVDDEEARSVAAHAAGDEVLDERLARALVLGRPFVQAQHVLFALLVDPERNDDPVVAPVDAAHG